MSRFNPDIHHRRSIRMRSYDYATGGMYFVTVCTHERQPMFGDIADGGVRLNPAGNAIKGVIRTMPGHHPGIDVDSYVIMPDHVHIIFSIDHVGAGPRACPPNARACPSEGHPRGGAPTLSLPDLMHRFKSMTTALYRHGVVNSGWPVFNGRLWQRNYWERIIRNDVELNALRGYIRDNPKMNL